MRFIHELLARMIGALTLKNRLIDWLWQTDRPLRGWAARRWRLGALSIIPFNKNSGLKFRKFYVPNGTAHSGCTAPTKERYWGQQFCQMERDISVRPTEITGAVKVDHLQSWSRTFRSDQIEMVRSIELSIWCTNRNFRNFGLNGKHLTCLLFWTISSVFFRDVVHRISAILQLPTEMGDRYEFLVISCGHSTDFYLGNKFWEGHTTDIGSQGFHAHLKFLADQRDVLADQRDVFFFYLAVISYANLTFKVKTGEDVDDSCPQNLF